jgi:hypothetical protein
MMSLNINRIVNVSISVSALALQRAGFGILNIIGVDNKIPPSERVRTYSDIDGVAEDFAVTDEEYLAASIFFSQSPRPPELYISRRNNAPTLEGGDSPETDLATWQAITDGSFAISYDGGEDNGTVDLNFSSVTSMSDVAEVISEEDISTCIWTGEKFIYSPAGQSAESFTSISFMSATLIGTDISGLLACRSTDGGTTYDNETISESLSAIEAVNSKWYGFAFTSEVRDDSQTAAGTIADCLDAAAWAEPRIKVFANNSSDANTLSATDETNISYQLSQLGYSRTFTVYNEGDYPAISTFARGASVDYEGSKTTITYKFKQLPGLSASDLSSSQASAISSFDANYYANFGTQLSGDSVAILAEGVCASGRFIDEVVGLDWLQNAIETDVFNYIFQSTTKIPQTDEGVSGIVQVLSGVLDTAVTNGLLAPGTVTIDDDEVFLDKGYYIYQGLVEDQSQADREAREAPPISFIAKGAGAIHGVTISGTFVR